MAGVLIGLHLAARGFDEATIGSIVGAGLAGAAAGTFIITLFGDRVGRRASLVSLALLSAAGGVAVALLSGPIALGAAAFLGMINGMGRDRGAGLVIETAVLPATVSDERRTRTFAVYNMLQDAGHALGSLLAGLPEVVRKVAAVDAPSSLRIGMLAYAGLCLVPVALYLRLSPAIESARRAERVRLQPRTKKTLTKICALFAVDSLAGGLLATALLAYFFQVQFGASEAMVAGLFFAARIANMFSHLGAGWLARRIGLVNTMVFTHIPSSLLLITVAYAPSFPIAAALFLIREGLVEMDVPTRQSYVMAVVRPEERTFASGITALVRIAAWAVGPWFAGLFMQDVGMMTPLYIGAAMKIAYDILLWISFRRLRPPEEQTPSPPPTS